MQYAIEDGEVYVLEANPRASSTVPLVSKVCNIKMVKLATEIMTCRPDRTSVSGPGAEGEEDSALRREGSQYSRSRCSRRLTRYSDRRCVPQERFSACLRTLERRSTRHRRLPRQGFQAAGYRPLKCQRHGQARAYRGCQEASMSAASSSWEQAEPTIL